jgi:TRAP-type C4-dicarboxylate transport system substrate-binding protein
MNSSVKSLILASGISLLSATTTIAAEYNFKLHHFLGATSPSQTETIEPWARAVEEASGGRVSIEIFPSMSLGGRPPELVGQARDGVVDIIWTVNGYTPGVFPRTEVFELPFVHTNNPGATNLAMAELFDAELAVEYKGLEVMFLHVHGGNGLHTVDTPVHEPADVNSLKIRTPSRTGAWTIEALGASAAAMPVPALPQALATKAVDAAFVPWEIIPALKLQEQTKYQIEGINKTRFGTLVFQMSMNKSRWNDLPDDIKQAFRAASGNDWLAHLGEVWEATDTQGIAMAVEAGNTHIMLDQAQTDAFELALKPVIERWVDEANGAGIDGADLLAKAQASIAKHAK